MSRIQHKVNFLAEFNWFEFKVFSPIQAVMPKSKRFVGLLFTKS